MSAAKFAEVSARIAGRVREGVYQDTLPSTRALAAEFGVARQTMTNALRPLVDKGLLIPMRGSLGMKINREYRDLGGLVGVVAGCCIEEMLASVRVGQLGKLIENDGFTPVLLGLIPGRMPLLPERLFKADFSGVVFIDSSLTLDAALFLETRGVPFVSANRLPSYPRLNFVEYSAFISIRQLTEHLRRNGYRNVALCFVSRLENYNRLIRREWRKIKAALELPLHEYDYYEPKFSSRRPIMVKDYLSRLCVTPEPLDAVVIWNGLDPAALPMCSSGALAQAAILYADLDPATAVPRRRFYQIPHAVPSGLPISPLWQAMRELLVAAPGKPIHRFVPYPIEMPTDLPVCPVAPATSGQ